LREQLDIINQKKQIAEENLQRAVEDRLVHQSKYDDLTRDITAKERENDIRYLRKVVQKKIDLIVEMKSLQSTGDSSIAIRKLECNIELLSAKALQLRQKHDIPEPQNEEEEEKSVLEPTPDGSLFNFISTEEVQETDDPISDIIPNTNSELLPENQIVDESELTPEKMQERINLIATLTNRITILEENLKSVIEQDAYEDADKIQSEIEGINQTLSKLTKKS